MSEIRFDFAGRSVLVTGAARGIGLAVARRFREAGAYVVMVDLDAGEIGEVAAQIDAIGVAADVRDTDAVDNVVATIVEQTGRIDVLVNNAGVLRDRVLWKLTDDDWRTVLDTHDGGAFRFTRACVPHFRRQHYGRVLNMTSYTGLHGNRGQANYATAKAGLIGLTKAAAKELAAFGVTVNAISPNAATQMTATIPPEQLAGLLGPIARLGSTDEIAAAVCFLASEDAGYITGAVIPVDGGLSI